MRSPITELELARLNSAQTEKDWSEACDAIKAARGGHYPEDWFERVMLSGVIERAAKRFETTGSAPRSEVGP